MTLEQKLKMIMAGHNKIRFATVDGVTMTHCIAYHPEAGSWSVFDIRNGISWLYESQHFMLAYNFIKGKREYERVRE